MRYFLILNICLWGIFLPPSVFADEEVSQALESLARQEIKKLALSEISSGQKKHFKIYMGVNAVMCKGKYNSKKVFAAKYAPVYESVEKYLPLLEKTVGKYRRASDAALEKGNEKLALQRGKAAELYEKLYIASKQILEDRKYENQSRMDKNLNSYYLVEVEMKYYRLKTPKRDWLTCEEACKLSSDWHRMKRNKEK